VDPGVTELIAVLGAGATAIAALTALVVQTTKLVQIAEQYMIELKRQNDVTNLALGAKTPGVVLGDDRPPAPGPGRTDG